MELKDLSKRHGAFYAPAFSVRVGGEDLTRTLGIAVSQAEADLTLSAMGRFSFTVVDSYDEGRHAFLSARGQPVLQLLKFGASVEVAIGYGDHSRLPRLLSGVISEITTGFAQGGSPELTVSGYDLLFPMTLGKESFSWSGASDSDIIAKLASKYHLSPDIESTSVPQAQTEQNQESDFDLMKKLAERNHFEFYADADKKLRFGKPRDSQDGVVMLSWGQGLLSFKPEANLAAQVSAVEVYGWDAKRCQAIVGKAVAGEESGHDPRRKSGGEQLKAAVGKAPVLQVRQPVFTEAEAKRRAQAILNDHAKKFLTGEAECVGLPELRPDRNVTLANLGDPFSKTYYINQTTHKFDSGGYRTRFKVKETSL
jgi:phage protein D